MSYWNRDLHRQNGETLKGWHDECFPVPLPKWHELCGYATVDDYIDATFGGTDHRRYLESLPPDHPMGHYATEVIPRHRNDAIEPMTPHGYAWVPWRFGGPCAACGKAA